MNRLPVGFGLFKTFLSPLLERVPLNINLPETLMKDDNDTTFMLYTERGILQKRKVTLK
jgi:hypothetical protein